jgi:hypothetical protein
VDSVTVAKPPAELIEMLLAGTLRVEATPVLAAHAACSGAKEVESMVTVVPPGQEPVGLPYESCNVMVKVGFVPASPPDRPTPDKSVFAAERAPG